VVNVRDDAKIADETWIHLSTSRRAVFNLGGLSATSGQPAPARW
jgi:hypothetical protein